MTTITFRKELKIDKLQFDDLSDFVTYLNENYYPTEILPLSQDECTDELVAEAEEAKETPKSRFLNV